MDPKQRGVLGGMAIGTFSAFAFIVAGIVINPFGYPPTLDFSLRITIAIKYCLFPATCLAVSVGRLAKHRFLTPKDIDGSGVTQGTIEATILQSLIQNTLEQSLIASVVYLAWSVVMPAIWLSVVPLAAVTFALGRIMFYTGYGKGAPSRAAGFALTFYPSVGMLICLVFYTLLRV